MLGALWATVACAQPYALIRLDVPEGMVIPPTVHVNLSELASVLGVPPPERWEPVCALESGDGHLTALLTQFDPGPDFDAATHAAGTVSMVLPAGAHGSLTVRLYPGEAPEGLIPAAIPEQTAVNVARDGERVIVTGGEYRVTHDPAENAGLPASIEFLATGKVFSDFAWNDRVYEKSLGGFNLSKTTEPKVEVVAAGPIRALVRLYLAYTNTGGGTPDSQPAAVYEFSYYRGLPLVKITANCRQEQPFDWPEHHFVEINFPGEDFTHLATSQAADPKALTAEKTSTRGTWAALMDGDNTLGLVADGTVIYDGRGGYGTYIHGPWVGWSGTERDFASALFISGSQGSLDRLKALAPKVGLKATATVTCPRFLADLEALRERARELDDAEDTGRWLWALALVERAGHAEGRLALAAQALGSLREAFGQESARPLDLVAPCFTGRLTAVDNGQIGLGLMQPSGSFVRLFSLFDFASEREYLAGGDAGNLFRLNFTSADGKAFAVGGADGWGSVEIAVAGSGTPKAKADITLKDPLGREITGLTATVHAWLEGRRAELNLEVDNASEDCSLRLAEFPVVRLAPLNPGEDAAFVPKGSGVLYKDPLRAGSRFQGSYPSGWCSMQFGGYYDSKGGVYFAAHDPVANYKDIRVTGEADALACSLAWHAPSMGSPGNDFRQAPCVLQPFEGDWFDAAQIYKAWARDHAGWWPRDDESRPDTPQWMKEIAIWSLMSGGPKNVVEPCIRFQEYMGVPTALHWYSWHQIPFDDNYPHYFPAKDGFAEGVKALQDAGVRVMPYINGRLWDSDTEDFETVALPHATKTEKGDPYLEEYGSKQKLAAMCPTTSLWQSKVREIVLRLVGPEYNVDGVYIDQIGAAAPRLCFDATHAHPAGGGHWWCTAGYWPMLTAIQESLPEGKMITTECNADAYCRWMDGYLSWHFQEQGQIPLFAAVYGGRVQIFSRAYKGSDKLAYRMKTAQALVFGEQLGWINTGWILNNPDVEGPFFRRLARLRYALLPYLSWGEMARPPVVEGNIPDVTADWAWHDYWPVTDSALQRGAWKAEDGRLALIFVNSTDQPVKGTLKFDGETYGFDAGAYLSWTPRDEDGAKESFTKPCAFDMPLEVEPYGAVAFEIKAL